MVGAGSPIKVGRGLDNYQDYIYIFFFFFFFFGGGGVVVLIIMIV